MARKTKQERREKKKRREEARSRDWTLRRQLARDFPEVIYINHNSPESIVAEVREIIEHLKVTNELPSLVRKSLRRLKAGDYRPPLPPMKPLSITLGNEIYKRLSQSFQTFSRMAHDIYVEAGLETNGKVRITLRSLETLSGRVFSSPRKPSIQVNGIEYRVAFREHAIERIGERTVVDPDLYESRGQAFAIPYWCKYFEPVQNRKGQWLAKIWNWCDPSIFLRSIQQELLGPHASPKQLNGWPFFELGGKLCYYLVGYCPVRFLDDLPGVVVLDSLWLPGMDHTPEYEAICHTEKLDTVGRFSLAKQVAETTIAKLAESRDFDTVRRLHAHVPQVKAIEAKVFDYPWLPD